MGTLASLEWNGRVIKGREERRLTRHTTPTNASEARGTGVWSCEEEGIYARTKGYSTVVRGLLLQYKTAAWDIW